MKKLVSPGKGDAAVSRRKFLRQGAAVATGLMVVPRRVLGGRGYVPPSDKVNIAIVGVGGRGSSHVGDFVRRQDANLAAVCDVDTARTSARFRHIIRRETRSRRCTATSENYTRTKTSTR